ncbi:bifunctional folylpolyglutamate synthase/dihydrofolate synthase [Dyadobacter psychrotolerans]|uniref:Dihydrofolate synthase/folylpolyglutamate synthase n=1 Tax=Dyadobacter psychrotolerans TaxID=2541721 RepID=A0A4R5DTA8_9BACT|nr:folylpolyglutamate synthase/dihydrofolate synthase family protein [Dyadobacter psychrotolerans]TDE17756.1 bifunctional folylpolyglutamate synthase/dihydrofolate synthase [Dyadobacter psychrotolerans]
MDYQQTIDYLYSRLPVFQNIGARAYKPGLHTTSAFCKLLGDPQSQFPSIHVGGTNGKGSTSHMLAAILQTAGYKVGLYTSPHLKSFTERIKINGNEVEEDFIVKFTHDNLSNIDRLSPSFFEVTVAMAFSYFAESKVDIAVIEVGMGGRFDSTNIIEPIISVITNVSYDHTQYLGDTLEKIAFEKGGIIKFKTPVVISEYQSETSGVFEEIARDKETHLLYASDQFRVRDTSLTDGKLLLSITDTISEEIKYKDLCLDLTGEYQYKNICGVLASVEILRSKGYVVSVKDIYDALSRVVELTGLKGRWQKLRSEPAVYCDTAHNEAGMSFTIPQFMSIEAKNKRFVIGFVSDKDITALLSLFPKGAEYYFTQPSNARALEASKLHVMASEFGLVGKEYDNVNSALENAVSDSKPGDAIYVGGSTFVVADLIDL